MNTKTMRKAARDLVPGDVVVYPDDVRLVVFAIDQSDPNSGAPPFTSIHWATLGDYRPTKPLFCSPDSQFMVELPAGLTPVQAAADKLLELCLEYFTNDSEKRHAAAYAELRALLDELDPPKPPTLQEAVALLRSMRGVLVKDSADAVNKFLARVPD